MKKLICLLLAVCMVFGLFACGTKQEAPAATAEPEVKEWTRKGYFTDDNENLLSITWMDDVVDPGWYVGAMIGDIMGGDTISQEGGSLRGNLNGWDESAEPLMATVSEEGEDGVLVTIEGGETYHFIPYDMPEATIFINVNIEGYGNIDYAEGEEAPEIDPEYPYQSAIVNLAEPTTYTFVAWAPAGSVFVKWTKNGEDFSTEPQITVLLDESADFVAVFEDDPGWQNPVMNFVGDYQSGRARATVSCFGNEDAWINITWAGSAWEEAMWDIVGRLDTDTLTIEYSGCTKQILTYDERGEVVNADVAYEDGTGTITFNYEENSFTWHEDQSEYGTDMVFEWVPVSIGCEIDYGSSELYTWEELDEAVTAIMERFAEFEGCELHAVRYAGDEANNEANLAWLNSLSGDGKYVQVMEFLSDFHSPVEDGPYAWEIDTEYTNYQWWLARTAGGGWEVVSWGY